MNHSVTHATFSLERSYPAATRPGVRGLGRPGRQGQVVHTRARLRARARLPDRRPRGGHRRPGRRCRLMTFETLYRDIVPEQRIVYTSTLSTGADLMTVSPHHRGVHARRGWRHPAGPPPSRAPYLDSQEQPTWREQGHRRTNSTPSPPSSAKPHGLVPWPPGGDSGHVAAGYQGRTDADQPPHRQRPRHPGPNQPGRALRARQRAVLAVLAADDAGAVPGSYRPLAIDLRGFGDTDDEPIDATPGGARLLRRPGRRGSRHRPGPRCTWSAGAWAAGWCCSTWWTGRARTGSRR